MQSARGTMTLGRAVIWFAAAYLAAIAGYLGLSAAAGRLLGPDSFGYFVIALTLAMVAGQVGLIGVHRSGLREAARLERDDVERLAELRRGVRAVVLISLPLAGVVTGLIAWLLAGSQSTVDRAVIAVSVAALVVLNGLQKLWANYLRGFGQVRIASMLEGRSGGAVVALLQAAMVAIVWQLFPSWGLAGALAAVVLGYAIPVGYASRVVSRHWGHATSTTRVLHDLRKVAARDWRFASVQVGTLLNASVEVWIAGLILTSIDTSMFGAAQRLSFLVALPMTALQIVFSPSISRLAVSGSPEKMQRLLRTGATLAAAVTAVFALPLMVAPGPILKVVYGPGFQEAITPLVILTLALVVNALTGLAGLTLSMAHREGIAARVQWGALVTRVAIGTVAAAALGLNALALSAALVSSGMFVFMWRRTKRELGVNTAVTAHIDLSVLKEKPGVQA
jgi:O-antigen/teichoic acid export membrane protein